MTSRHEDKITSIAKCVLICTKKDKGLEAISRSEHRLPDQSHLSLLTLKKMLNLKYRKFLTFFCWLDSQLLLPTLFYYIEDKNRMHALSPSELKWESACEDLLQ